MKCLSLILILFSIYSCIGREEKYVKAELIDDKLISAKGEYCSPKRNICLNIDVVNNIVEFNISDTSGNIFFKSSRPSISHLQNLGFLIDNSGVIWMQSTDIGLYTLKSENGKYKFVPFALNSQNITRLT